MATIIETSYDSSENELLDQSLSVWKGSTSSYGSDDEFEPLSVDLHTAASLGQFDCVRGFLNHKHANPNAKNKGGWTPLMYASYIGHDNIIHLLLDAGVDVEATNKKGQTSLMLAACCGNESIAYFLLNAGAQIEARDNLGWTTLFHATYAGHQNVVKFLLENGADMEAREPCRGMTPFMQAALEGHEIIVQDFLHHGVDIEAKAYSGDTARSMALYVGHKKVVSLIDNAQMRPVRRRGKQDEQTDGKKSRVPSILDGPAAFARMMDRTPSAGGDGNCANGPPEIIRSRDMTSPIRPEDCRLDGSWNSSPGKSSDADDEDDCNDVFSQTGALTIKSSSSGSSGGLAAALGVTDLNDRHSDFDPPITNEQRIAPPTQPTNEFPDTLEGFLEKLGLGKYLSIFVDQDVDLQVFLSLTDNDLKEVGIKLFGPRRKMTNAIARWHSNLSCSMNKLEQSYADKLEAEMQELAIQLHKACDQIDKMKAEVLQERELRSVAESCLMEAWQHVRRLVADTKQQCVNIHELKRRSSFCLHELLRRQLQYKQQNYGQNVDSLAAGLLERLQLDGTGSNDVTLMADDHVTRLLVAMMEKIGSSVLEINSNTEKLLGKEVNFQDSFGRVT